MHQKTVSCFSAGKWLALLGCPFSPPLITIPLRRDLPLSFPSLRRNLLLIVKYLLCRQVSRNLTDFMRKLERNMPHLARWRIYDYDRADWLESEPRLKRHVRFPATRDLVPELRRFDRVRRYAATQLFALRPAVSALPQDFDGFPELINVPGSLQ